MKNPIAHNFDWSSLYFKYDATCKRFDPYSPSLYAFQPKPVNDRELYYFLIEKVAKTGRIDLGTYEGIMYWKLYSQPAAVANVCYKIRKNALIQENITNSLVKLNKELPNTLTKEINAVKDIFFIVQQNAQGLYGLSNSCALPVRSTLLHFLYPDAIPIFDKQVLLAVGVNEKDANRKYQYLYEYIQHAWNISGSSIIPHNWKESPLRLIDMALWVLRGRKEPAEVDKFL